MGSYHDLDLRRGHQGVDHLESKKGGGVVRPINRIVEFLQLRLSRPNCIEHYYRAAHSKTRYQWGEQGGGKGGRRRKETKLIEFLFGRVNTRIHQEIDLTLSPSSRQSSEENESKEKKRLAFTSHNPTMIKSKPMIPT